MKKSYITPRIDIISVRVERGFAGSLSTMYLGSNEEVSSNGGIHFGNGAASDNGSNMEGINDNGAIFL